MHFKTAFPPPSLNFWNKIFINICQIKTDLGQKQQQRKKKRTFQRKTQEVEQLLAPTYPQPNLGNGARPHLLLINNKKDGSHITWAKNIQGTKAALPLMLRNRSLPLPCLKYDSILNYRNWHFQIASKTDLQKKEIAPIETFSRDRYRYVNLLQKSQVLWHLKYYGIMRFVGFADKKHGLAPIKASKHSQMAVICQEGQVLMAGVIGKVVRRTCPHPQVEINWNSLSEYGYLL